MFDVTSNAVPSVRACPICLGDLDMQPAARGALYTCRYCGELEIKLQAQPASAIRSGDHRGFAA